MKINEHIALSSSKILLVPYSKHHVSEYHVWMQDAELQAATASEPLTVEEEYAMQESWRADRDKLTFIACLPFGDDEVSRKVIEAGVDDTPSKMIGDVNLFLFDRDNEDDEDEDGNIDASIGEQDGQGVNQLVGEIELMIARKDLHRQGYGRAALLAFLHYILSEWSAIATEYAGIGSNSRLAYLRVKINQTNVRSIALFESIGFARTSKVANYFGEIELRCYKCSPDTLEQRSWTKPRILEFVVA